MKIRSNGKMMLDFFFEAEACLMSIILACKTSGQDTLMTTIFPTLEQWLVHELGISNLIATCQTLSNQNYTLAH